MPTQTVLRETKDSDTSEYAPLLSVIQNYPLFATLPLATQARLIHLLIVERHKAEEVIFRFNDPGNSMYFLCSGSVRFITRDYTGREVELEEIHAGDLFGEVALYTDGPRTADAIATSDVTLLVLRIADLHEFLRTCPEVSEYLLKRMASRLSSSSKMLRSANVQVEEVVAAERSLFDRIVKRIVDVFGTLPSLVVHLVILISYIVLKLVVNAPFMAFEKPELFFLNLFINLEAFAVSMLILVNQSRESKEESVRDRTEFEATLHTDSSLRFLHEKVDALAAELRRLQAEVPPPAPLSGERSDGERPTR